MIFLFVRLSIVTRTDILFAATFDDYKPNHPENECVDKKMNNDIFVLNLYSSYFSSKFRNSRNVLFKFQRNLLNKYE